MSIRKIRMSDLYKIISQRSSEDCILDTRSPEEYSSGHVPGSMNIPYDQVSSHIDQLKKYRNIYIYCKAGGRAMNASETLSGLGIKTITCVVDSGMPNWLLAGHPIEK